MIKTEALSIYLSKSKQIQFPDLYFSQGESGILLGASGSGKTTLLHLLAGLKQGYEGSLQIGNQHLSRLSEAKLDAFRGRNIGLVMQQAHLLKALTVGENLRAAQYLAGTSTDKRKVVAVLERLGLGGLRKMPVNRLSHGQAQRVAIARAMLHTPQVLLADEPTASLDDENAHIVAQLLSEQSKLINATLLVATHDQRIKPYFQQVIQL